MQGSCLKPAVFKDEFGLNLVSTTRENTPNIGCGWNPEPEKFRNTLEIKLTGGIGGARSQKNATENWPRLIEYSN